jgi:hypothetical protein
MDYKLVRIIPEILLTLTWMSLCNTFAFCHFWVNRAWKVWLNLPQKRNCNDGRQIVLSFGPHECNETETVGPKGPKLHNGDVQRPNSHNKWNKTKLSLRFLDLLWQIGDVGHKQRLYRGRVIRLISSASCFFHLQTSGSLELLLLCSKLIN